ncbi:spore coat protein [Clostridium sp. DJ247]|uniref:spore coat protein n=1 Tax=Clostridium sp. DJ247 TaxID=2726188 RepID=UPI0016287E14|nr:spore coat protein [Clostridium sp. DJ247]MBC2581633.1 spore coat protein [Clostridium sp. DJ247]
MSWVDDLFGSDDSQDDSNKSSSNNDDKNSKLNDKEIALDMLIMSKLDITSMAKAVTETTNPQLRQMLSSQLNNCINQHFRLADMAINKQWYNAYASPQQQLQQDITEVQQLQ